MVSTWLMLLLLFSGVIGGAEVGEGEGKKEGEERRVLLPVFLSSSLAFSATCLAASASASAFAFASASAAVPDGDRVKVEEEEEEATAIGEGVGEREEEEGRRGGEDGMRARWPLEAWIPTKTFCFCLCASSLASKQERS